MDIFFTYIISFRYFKIVSIGGIILTYIYPKKVQIPNTNILFYGNFLKIIDILFHHIPLLLLFCVYDKKIKKDNLIFAVSIILLYILFNNPLKIYFFCE